MLVLLDHYLPGERNGGPVQSVAALVEGLADELEFRIVTRDRDVGDDRPYPGWRRGAWRPEGRAEVRELAPGEHPRELPRLLRAARYDVLLVNTLFSAWYGVAPLVLRRLGIARRMPLVLAPRGQLDREALAISSGRKRAYLALARLTGLFSGAIWQATDASEAAVIRARIGEEARIETARDPRREPVEFERPPREDGGPLRIAFLSRIAPTKNLDGALRILGEVRVPVEFDVYGPLEDEAYWKRCQALIERLPDHVRARHRGVVPNAEVPRTLAAHDLFLLPSRGESFGHVIADALAAGCPVLISDRTPWRELERHGVGWDVPLEDEDRFRAIIEACAAEPPQTREQRARAAASWPAAREGDRRAIEDNRAVLRLALGDAPAPEYPARP